MFPKILVFSASSSSDSSSARLAARAVKEFVFAGADVTWISLIDFPLPMFDGEPPSEFSAPANACNLKRQFMAHHGIFIVGAEFNASVSPLLKNALDWISLVRVRAEPPLAAFRDRVFALGTVSDRDSGGNFGLSALRQVLQIGCGAAVLPEDISVPRAREAFDEMGNLRDPHLAERLQRVATQLVDAVQEYARGAA